MRRQSPYYAVNCILALIVQDGVQIAPLFFLHLLNGIIISIMIITTAIIIIMIATSQLFGLLVEKRFNLNI